VHSLSRRSFLKASAALTAFSATIGFSPAQSSSKDRRLKKAIMFATVGLPGSLEEKFQAIKDAGFAGVEPSSHEDSKAVLKARDKSGLQIPSVCCATHWHNNLGSPNASERERGVEGLKKALADAGEYGASSVLLVPAIVNEQVSYEQAYARSQEEIRKALPLAEKLKVHIAIENVWNNFLLSPLEMARYIDDFQSPMVGAHFDIGNVLRYGWPEQWISVLGKRILKLHFKEFSRKKMNDEGLFKGFQVQYLEGDNNWSAIMKALGEVGYDGWAIAEPAYPSPAKDAEGLKNISNRMDQIFQK
jgi:L-ribulose-5-phosphate 3-epimerase